MRIRTFLSIGTLISAIVALVAVTGLSAILLDVREAVKKNAASHSIGQGVFELTSLAGDYLLYLEDRARRQWEDKHISIGWHLRDPGYRGAEKDLVIADLRHHQVEILSTFQRLTRTVEQERAKGVAPGTTARSKRLIAQFLAGTQAMAAAASRLSEGSMQELQENIVWAIWLIGALIFILAIMLGATWLMVARRLIAPVQVLEESTAEVAAGNLDHRIAIESRDEIGDLAYAFNTMTGRLKETLASRDELDREITERTRVEAALRESEELSRALINAPTDAAFLIDKTGILLSANEAMAKRFGKTPDEIIGTDIFALFPPELAAQRRKDAAKVFETQEPLKTEDVRQGRILSNHIFPVANPDGTVHCLAIFSRDVTETRRAEERIRASESRFRQLVESTNVVAWELDLDSFRFTYVSPHAVELLGYPLEDWKAAGFWADHIHTDDRDAAVALCAAQTEAGQDHEFEYRMIRADGAAVWLRDIVTVHKDEDGDPVRLTGFLVDIDERKQTEEALERSNAELQQFAYVASHDLQEPLRMVTSYNQLLAHRYKGKLGKDADDYIAFAVDGAKRMQRLIKDLLEYSRVETRAQDLVPIDSGESLGEALGNLDIAISEAGATVTVDSMPEILGDPPQVVRLFQNLIGNAIKYAAPERPPQVHISAKPRESEWIFTITDNGIGMEAEYLEKIFVLFQRLHGRDEYEGTGIGLAICKKVVERHGGRIWARSTPGEGSTFHFTLQKPYES